MSILSYVLAAVAVAAVAIQTARALRAQPDALRAMAGLWRSGPWARQIFLDFYGLEVVLALWMLGHAAETGSWAAAIVCVAAMPVAGAMAAGAYWLWAV